MHPKKIFVFALMITFWAFARTPFILSAQSKNAFPLLYEAEHGNYVDLTLMISAGASNGQFLRMATSGSVTWNVQVSQSGWYCFQVKYQASAGDEENILLKNQVEWPMGFGWANQWDFEERLVHLDAGLNIIGIKCTNGGIDIDCMAIDTVSVTPHITPQNNIFYSRTPRDLYVKMNAYGRSISSISAGGVSLSFSTTAYPFEEDAWLVKIDSLSLSALPVGSHSVVIEFAGGENIAMNLKVMTERTSSILTIIAPHVDHGNAVLFILPTGKTMLVDCGQATWRDRVVIPLLHKNFIDKLDYFIITHYHEDHDGGDNGATIMSQFNVGHFYDYKSFKVGDVLDLEGVRITIFNAYDSSTDENNRSLAFQLKFNGFVYSHGADIYGTGQRSIMGLFPYDVYAHVYSANHHFHGSVDSEYIRVMDPCIVFVQAQEAIYARSAYVKSYLKNSAQWLREHGGRLMDNLPALEVGTIVIRANDENDWTYETYKESETPLIPFIPQTMHLHEDRSNDPIFIRRPQENIETNQTKVDIEFMTDKSAFLRYSAVDQPYESMPHDFEMGQGLNYHKTTLAGEHGQKLTLYVRAMDLYGNAMDTSAVVTFAIDTLLKPINWNDFQYNDTEWGTGQAPLGYGTWSLNTRVDSVRTLYVRKKFAMNAVPSSLRLQLKGDDGLIAYVNSHEIVRINMPARHNIDYDTFAESLSFSKIHVFESENLAALNVGDNVLAIELHQANVVNPDLSIDASLYNRELDFIKANEVWQYYDAEHRPRIQTYKDTNTGTGMNRNAQVKNFQLFPNYPNPFNSVTTISYIICKPAPVILKVIDLLGKEVNTVVSGYQFPGTYSVDFEATELASGIYFCRLQAGDSVVDVKKMIILK